MLIKPLYREHNGGFISHLYLYRTGEISQTSLPTSNQIHFTGGQRESDERKGGGGREREREEAKEVKCTTSLVVFFPTANFNTNLLFFRSVAGVDVDPDLVHMEMQDTSGGMMLFFQCACMYVWLM